MNDQLELLMVIINLVSGALWKDKSVKIHHKNVQVLASEVYPVDTGRKLNVHKTFGGRPGRLLNVLCTFNLRPVSTGHKVKHELSPQIMNNVFELNSVPCNLKREDLFQSRNVPFMRHDTQFDLSQTKDLGYCTTSNQK